MSIFVFITSSAKRRYVAIINYQKDKYNDTIPFCANREKPL